MYLAYWVNSITTFIHTQIFGGIWSMENTQIFTITTADHH